VRTTHHSIYLIKTRLFFDPELKICDGTDCTQTTFSQINNGKKVEIYNPPSVDCYYSPNPTAVGVETTLYVTVNNPGVTDDNGGGCEIKVDWLNDGYIDETRFTCSSFNKSYIPQIAEQREDRAIHTDYRGTSVFCLVSLIISP